MLPLYFVLTSFQRGGLWVDVDGNGGSIDFGEQFGSRVNYLENIRVVTEEAVWIDQTRLCCWNGACCWSFEMLSFDMSCRYKLAVCDIWEWWNDWNSCFRPQLVSNAPYSSLVLPHCFSISNYPLSIHNLLTPHPHPPQQLITVANHFCSDVFTLISLPLSQ